MRPPILSRLASWVAVDCLVATGYGLVGLFGAYEGLRVSPTGLRTVLAGTAWIGIVLTCAALAVRRRYPVPAAAVLLLAAVLPPPVWLSMFSWSYVLYIVATRELWTALGALAVALTTIVVSYHEVSPALAVAIVWITGFVVGRHRTYEQRARTAEVTEERLRIARELHDVVAHSISVITVQAGFGHLVIDKHPAQAREALAAIEATGRETLTEMRRLLGVLRDDPPDRSPAPGLTMLDRLTEQTAQAGVTVALTTTGPPRPLQPGIDLSAYRIVQEALTNVVKHANTTTCELVVGYGDNEVTLEITDRGSGGPIGTGHGLTGMRERAKLCGGELSAQPLPDGGFRVTARLVESA